MIRNCLWGSGLWGRGYYDGTAESVTSETMQKYIQNQKNV
ncbi:transposase [Halanaerobium sp. MA284_MarDTE_T2]